MQQTHYYQICFTTAKQLLFSFTFL